MTTTTTPLRAFHGDSAITIPMVATGPTRTNPRVLTVYALEKTGKSSAVAAIPDSLLFCIDPNGADYLTARKLTRERELPDYRAFLRVCEQCRVARAGGTPYARRGVLDTISDLEEWAFEKARDDWNNGPKGKSDPVTHILDLPGPKGSAGWGPFRAAFGELLQAFELAFDEIVWVAHQKDTKLTRLDGSASVDDIDAIGKMRDVLCRQSSAIGFLSRQGALKNELWINFASDDLIRCGSRCPYLAGRKIKLGESVVTGGVYGTPTFDWSPIYIPDPEVKP